MSLETATVIYLIAVERLKARRHAAPPSSTARKTGQTAFRPTAKSLEASLAEEADGTLTDADAVMLLGQGSIG